MFCLFLPLSWRGNMARWLEHTANGLEFSQPTACSENFGLVSYLLFMSASMDWLTWSRHLNSIWHMWTLWNSVAVIVIVTCVLGTMDAPSNKLHSLFRWSVFLTSWIMYMANHFGMEKKYLSYGDCIFWKMISTVTPSSGVLYSTVWSCPFSINRYFPPPCVQWTRLVWPRVWWKWFYGW